MVLRTSFPSRLVGVPPAARAYQVARLLESNQFPERVVILCPNQDNLHEFAADLETFLNIANKDQDLLSKGPQSSHSTRVSVFPTWEQSPVLFSHPHITNPFCST